MSRGGHAPLLLLLLPWMLPAGPASFWDLTEEEIPSFLEAMSDEETISQVFLIGYDGETPDPRILQWIGRYNLGGIKIFGRNAERLLPVVRSVAAYQEKALAHRSGIPLLVATDQEGGWVRHIKGETVETPGNMAIGATRLPYEAYQTGLLIGKELRALGITMNFAPTVDVYVNPEAHVIGPRSFGSDPRLVATLALSFYHGSLDAGVIPVAKHFPGHGNARGDSHGELPVVEDDLATLWERDWLPYRILIREGLPAVMVGHLNFPLLSKNDLPATLSSHVISLLREKLDFQGLVITDDLYMMGARVAGEDIPHIVVEALSAGNDMVLLSRPPHPGDPVWEAVLSRYRNDPEFRKRIQTSVRRILTLKIRYLKAMGPKGLIPSEETLREAFPDEETAEAFGEQALRAVTMVRSGKVPLSPGGDARVLLVGQHTRFLSIGKEYFPHADTFQFSYLPFYFASEQVKARLSRLVQQYDLVIYCLMNPNSLEVLASLEEWGPRIAVLSTLTPVYLAEVPWVDTAVAVYGTSEECYRGGFLALMGKLTPTGTLPISLTPSSGAPP
ncbi:glycoside hydrolase family 3 domain protein [Spirochaeta thermophila DSM 6578]|uniref:Glycoside hydrolase family 3 domain protein n=1 Tax=Winmispira thermophila (strain ATCC 700085 / DSM 6578 / Z-1203) TaxID=869211 RepID=G0GFX8_WINT7|nr:glycoside hydrolase family 3 protein [Spirochaeta thermophila]AEJ61671.1 glycoside hydrolase family 3 domain protein [Spirochaeta thermophila DSM 6578]